MQDSGATAPQASALHLPGVLPAKLGRYAAVATLLLKRRPDLITPDADTGGANAAAESAEAERLAKDLESSGLRSSSLARYSPRAPTCCRRRISKP